MTARRFIPYALLVNLALAVWVGYLVAARPGSPVQPPAPLPGKPARPPSAIPGPALVVTNTLRELFTWAKVESRDYPQYIANLRAVHCPESTLQDIIITDITKNYARQKAALQEARTREFWKTESQRPGGRSADASPARQLEREKRATCWSCSAPRRSGRENSSPVFLIGGVGAWPIFRKPSEIR